jgi:hypothetical protein
MLLYDIIYTLYRAVSSRRRRPRRRAPPAQRRCPPQGLLLCERQIRRQLFGMPRGLGVPRALLAAVLCCSAATTGPREHLYGGACSFRMLVSTDEGRSFGVGSSHRGAARRDGAPTAYRCLDGSVPLYVPTGAVQLRRSHRGHLLFCGDGQLTWWSDDHGRTFRNSSERIGPQVITFTGLAGLHGKWPSVLTKNPYRRPRQLWPTVSDDPVQYFVRHSARPAWALVSWTASATIGPVISFLCHTVAF